MTHLADVDEVRFGGITSGCRPLRARRVNEKTGSAQHTAFSPHQTMRSSECDGDSNLLVMGSNMDVSFVDANVSLY